MRRRQFLAALGGMAAGPLASYAQGPGLPVIGYLGPEAPERFASRVNAFRDGLAETGYIEGRNVGIEFRWADGDYQKLPALAADLAARQVAVMVAPGGAPNALAAKLATTTIPIVFEMGGDPVALGIVPSLSQPGGNLTGVSSLSVEVGPKRLESLHEVIPTASVFAVALNPTSPTANSQLEILKRTADALGLRLHVLHASAEQEFEQLFTRSPELGAGALVFTSDPVFAFRSQQLAALAIRHRVPAITQSRDFPLAGGLMSYGGDFVQSHRQAGVYAGRVLKGEKPSDLPIQLVTRVEFFINLKTARSLGLTVPIPFLARADEVIE
jgi:putative tryptophan/tyrosine transport system substrate-binding protein